MSIRAFFHRAATGRATGYIAQLGRCGSLHIDNFLSIYIFSSFVTIFTIDVGFSIKIFMFLTIITIPVLSIVNFELFFYECVLVLLWLYFIVTMPFSSPDISISARGAMGMVLVSLFYFVSRGIFQIYSDRVDRALHVACWMLVLVSLALYVLGIFTDDALLGVPRTSWGVMFERDLYRLTGVWIDPNFAGLGLTVVLLYALFWDEVRPILALFAFGAFVLCLSRGALVAFVAGVVLALVIKFAAGRLSWRNCANGLAGLLGVALVFVALWQVSAVREVLSHRFAGFADGSGRIELWSSGLAAWSAQPWLGVGLFHFGAAIGEPGRFAHNTALEVLIEGGIPAFVLYVAFAFSALWQATQTRHLAFHVATIGAFFVMSLTLSMLIYEVFFLFLALMAADSSRADSSRNDGRLKVEI